MKWRPSKLNCLYVIPDIHGAYDLLTMILKQILPLRKSDGGKDHLFFLGDYIDRHADSPKVINLLIQIEEKYPGQVHKLLGNHEDMALRSFNKNPLVSTMDFEKDVQFKNWTYNGGYATLQGYMDAQGIRGDAMDLSRQRAESLIPKEHWQFMASCHPYIIHDQYVFVHGGCDPYKDIGQQKIFSLIWDRSLAKTMTLAKEQQDFSWIEWEQTIVTGHNGPNPMIHPNYYMLDAGSPEKLMCLELQSMEAVMAIPGNSRLVKFDAVKRFGVIK